MDKDKATLYIHSCIYILDLMLSKSSWTTRKFYCEIERYTIWNGVRTNPLQDIIQNMWAHDDNCRYVSDFGLLKQLE